MTVISFAPPAHWMTSSRCRMLASARVTSGDVTAAELASTFLKMFGPLDPRDLVLEDESIRWWPVRPGVLVNRRGFELRESPGLRTLGQEWHCGINTRRKPRFFDTELRQWIYIL